MGPKILVVDDEMPVRSLLGSVLEGPGIAVFKAESGARALEIAEREAPFALVVTDILMPGMDGFDLAEELRAAGYAEQFLFISGYCDAETIKRRMQAFPAAALLGKPFPIAEFLRAVRRMLPPKPDGMPLRRPA